MKENQIKLNQIVTQKQLRQKRRASLHALNNSFKRNTLLNSASSNKYDSSYECRLPQVNFSRRDLSIILRYLLYKQQMQLSDRNLLRRILLSIFEQDLILAGSKRFINYLKLQQGVGAYKIQDSNSTCFYFVLKGKGLIKSGQFTYNVKEGETFGYLEIFSQQKIQTAEFQSRYLMVRLQKNHFNEFFKSYYEKIYSQRQSQLQSIKQYFLDRIPLLNKYIFLNKINYKSFTIGQKIVVEGQQIKFLYFLPIDTNFDTVPYKCIGLIEILKQKKEIQETIYSHEKITIPYVDIQSFQNYVLSMSNSFIMNQSNTFEKQSKKINPFLNQAPQRLVNFMKIKVVKLKPNRSRLKTDVSDFYETSFKFFKSNGNVPLRNIDSSKKNTRPTTNIRYERLKTTTYSKPLRNNFI